MSVSPRTQGIAVCALVGLVIVAGVVVYVRSPKPAVSSSASKISTEVVDTPTPPPPVVETKPTESPSMSTITSKHLVTIETNKGTIEFETYDSDAPKTAENFVSLAKKGFYDGVIFHRVIKGFMIQGGDPTGTGTGGPGYKFEDELNPATKSYKDGYMRGVVAMANAGPNTNGSQFFIMHQDYPLPNSYTIFGKVTKGMDIVDAIATSPVGPNDKPKDAITMKKVTVADQDVTLDK